MKKVIEQPGIVNLNIEVFIDDDLDITMSQSNSFTHDEIRIIKSKDREVALAICPDLEREIKQLEDYNAKLFEGLNNLLDKLNEIVAEEGMELTDHDNSVVKQTSELIELYKNRDNGK